MAVAWSVLLDRHIARPSVAQRRQLTGSFAGSVLSQPRGEGPPPTPRGTFSSRWSRAGAPLRWLRDQRVSSSLPVSVVGNYSTGRDVPSMRDGLDALARVNAAVRDGQLVAARRRSQGDLRPT